MEQNNINVVYAADDNFIPVMGVSIVSLLKNNRDMSNINVTILATNVSELNKQIDISLDGLTLLILKIH